MIRFVLETTGYKANTQIFTSFDLLFDFLENNKDTKIVNIQKEMLVSGSWLKIG
ncbi:MAG: hypothetical protein KKG99_17475 [Bacteroidetes bacterium]|nr:hypothetical protein [Bacteroidota bacterium]